jgi:hypothetical protein
MRDALEDLRLDRLTMIDPGDRAYALSDRIEIVTAVAIASENTLAILRPAARTGRVRR